MPADAQDAEEERDVSRPAPDCVWLDGSVFSPAVPRSVLLLRREAHAEPASELDQDADAYEHVARRETSSEGSLDGHVRIVRRAARADRLHPSMSSVALRR